jgi:hypothetical protein
MTSVDARLNLNEIPIIPWKGKVFYQLSSSLQPTQDTNPITSGDILFRPRPIKHAYRKEIAVNTTRNGNPRVSYKIDELTAPNGFLVYTDASDNAIQSCDGLVGYLDDQLPNDQTELGKTCNICNIPSQCVSTSTAPENTCFSVQLNAQRRVRSAGMILPKFNPNRNNDNRYFTDSNQYLVSRNRTIYQNSYNYIRKGDPTLQPGTGYSKSNVYSPQGLSHCERVYISPASNNNVFQYIWLDGQTYTATIPTGSYDINSFNQAFNTIMINNTHYYINNLNLAKQFLLVFSYNTLYGKVEIQALSASASYPASQYSKGGVWSVLYQVPQFIFLNNALPSLLGISPQTYPVNNTFTNTQILVAPNEGSLVPAYVQLYYKPSNPQFATQGGVSSSTYTARKIYDTITSNGFAYQNTLGISIASAISYRVSIPGYNVYSLKDQLGYPNKLIPKINGINGTLSCCTPTRFSNLY